MGVLLLSFNWIGLMKKIQTIEVNIKQQQIEKRKIVTGSGLEFTRFFLVILDTNMSVVC